MDTSLLDPPSDFSCQHGDSINQGINSRFRQQLIELNIFELHANQLGICGESSPGISRGQSAVTILSLKPLSTPSFPSLSSPGEVSTIFFYGFTRVS